MRPPDGFTHATPMDIRFGDLDALGHLNNAKYVTYMEHARVRYFRDAGLWDATRAPVGLIVARVSVDFLRPLGLGDPVHIFTRVSRLGTKSLDTEHVIARDDGLIAATGQIVLVVFDYTANASIPIPDAWRAALRRLEPGLNSSPA